MAQQIASLYARIGADISGLAKGLATAKGKLQSIGGTMAKTGAVMTAGITLPLLAIGKNVVQTAADFESSMNILSIAAKSSGTSMADLQDAAIAVGGDTRLVGISAAEAAEAMTDFYKAGLDTTDIFGNLNAYMEDGVELSGALAAAISLQAASELDLARASDVVSIAMATFGLESEDATRIADNFVRAADASVASVGELADAMVNVGPTAASFGWEMEDVNTALALLSQRGIKGAEAGTALKSMMTNIMRPTDKVVGMLKRLNIELYDENENLRSLPEIVGQLETAYAGLTEAEQHMVTQTLAGTYGMKAMNTLLTEGTEGWAEMEGAIANAASAQEVAGVRTQGMNAAMETLQGVLETLMIQVGIPLIQNVLTPLVEKFTGIAESVSGLDPKVLQLAVTFAAVAAAAGPVLTVVGALVTVAGALLSPIGLIAVAVVALGAAFVQSQGGIEGAKAKIMDIWAQLQVLWSGLLEKVMPVIQDLQALWELVFPRIQEITHNVIGDVAPFIQTLLGEAAAFVQEKFGLLIGWWGENFPLIQTTVFTVLNAIETVWNTVWPAIETALRVVWDVIKGIVETDINLILGILETAMLLITGDWEGAWKTIKETAAQYLEDAETVIRGVIDSILEFFGTTVEDAIEAGKNLIGGFKQGVKDAAGGLAQAAKDAINGAIDAAKRLLGIKSPSRVFKRIGRDTIKGLEEGVAGRAVKLQDAVKKAIKPITDIRKGTGPATGGRSVFGTGTGGRSVKKGGVDDLVFGDGSRPGKDTGTPITGVSRARAISTGGAPITITVSGNNLYATTPMELAMQIGEIIMQKLANEGVYQGAA